MATAGTEACEICLHDFNETGRKSVALPCGHDFCLTCLVRLKTSGNLRCPKCRGDWAELEVEAPPGMLVEMDDEGEKEFSNGARNKGECLCSKHQLPYVFYCCEEDAFICNKCVVELTSYTKLELIDDAIPQIKTEMAERIVEIADQIEENYTDLDDMEAELVEKLRQVQLFKKEVEVMELKIEECIKLIKSRKAANLSASVNLEEVERTTKKINSDLDMSYILYSRSALEQGFEPIELPSPPPESDSLLCNIACSFTEAMRADDDGPTEDSFVGELLNIPEELVDLLKTSEPDNPPSVDALMRLLLRAPAVSTQLITKVARVAKWKQERVGWQVVSSNLLENLLAMVDKEPTVLTLIALPDDPEVLTAAAVAAVAEVPWGFEVRLRFLDSFFKPQDVNRDLEWMENFVGKSRFHLTEFWGHLDAAGIAKLPRKIQWLGLVIGSEDDAKAVSDLPSFDELKVLRVSVSSSVAAQDLLPLPSCPVLDLYFPGLTDALVDSVGPILEALVPSKEFSWLCLPLSQLTGVGASLLAATLRDFRIRAVVIFASGPWQPVEEERKDVEAEFRRVVGCRVDWGISWLYGY